MQVPATRPTRSAFQMSSGDEHVLDWTPSVRVLGQTHSVTSQRDGRSLPDVDIAANLSEYLAGRSEPMARYASFNYCFNYFRGFAECDAIDATPGQLQVSCLQWGFYRVRGAAGQGSFDGLLGEVSAAGGGDQFVTHQPESVTNSNSAKGKSFAVERCFRAHTASRRHLRCSHETTRQRTRRRGWRRSRDLLHWSRPSR